MKNRGFSSSLGCIHGEGKEEEEGEVERRGERLSGGFTCEGRKRRGGHT